MSSKINQTIRELKVTTRLKETDDDGKTRPRIVMLSIPILEPYFAMPMHIASEKLGLCSTSLKW